MEQADRTRLIIWLAYAALLAGSIGIAFVLYQQPYDDLPSFYWATRLVFEQSLSPYQPAYFQALGAELDRKIYPFLYPPPSLVLFSPFLLVEYPQAKLFFSMLNLFLWWFLAWSAYRFYCELQSVAHDAKAAVIIFLLMTVFAPVNDNIRTGQVNLVVVACLAPLISGQLTTAMRVLAGILFAAAVILKVYLLLLLPLLVIFRAWTILASTLITSAVLISATFLLMPLALWGDWIMLSREGAGYGQLMPHVLTLPWNQSLNGFLMRQVNGREIEGLYMYWPLMLYVAAALIAGFIYFVIARYLTAHRHGMRLAVAMVLAVITLLAPLTWLHHFVFLIPAIVACFSLMSPRLCTRMILILATVLLGLPVLSGLMVGQMQQWPSSGLVSFSTNLAMSVPMLIAIIFVIALAGFIVRKL